MAKIKTSIGVQPNRQPQLTDIWVGRGWAFVAPHTRITRIAWVVTRTGKIQRNLITLGSLSLRLLGRENTWPHKGGLYVVQDNWRWPIWWVLFHLWRFLCWFERNLRLTASIWGFVKYDLGCEPRWRDFVLVWWIKKRKDEAFIRQGLDEISKQLEENT